MILKNSQGQVFYGLHFYSGVAEYHPPDKSAFRVFINEATIRAMGPSFTARPVFVMHVDGVEQDLNKLREDADGWVVESFYNETDGKHWAKFIVVSDRGKRAIAQGMKLSNAYAPKQFGDGGTWNGVSYDKEVLAGEYEHLALVPDPRYAESVILTPEQFKTYNEEKRIELQRLANQKEEKGSGMKLKLFKRAVVENSVDLENTMVELPKSKREVTLSQLVNEADEQEEKKKKEEKDVPMANGDHMVEYGGKKSTLNEMLAAHKTLNDELTALKARHYDDAAAEHHNDDDSDADDEAKKKKAMANEEEELKEKHKNELDALLKKHGKTAPEPTADELEKRRKDKEKADLLRNAEERARQQAQSADPGKIESVQEQVQRGKVRYGSN